MSFAQRRRISLSQVLSEYTATELNYWRAWDRREMSPENQIINIQAQLLSAFCNANRRKGTQPHTPADFIFKPNWNTKEGSDAETITNEINRAFK
jgi:hypothetical protein